mgnify:CR=1 FL=1
MLPDFRIRQRDYLLEISRALTEELDLNSLLARILGIAVELLSGQAGFIALADSTNGWHITVEQGIPSALLEYLQKWMKSLPVNQNQSNLDHGPEINRILGDVSMGILSAVGLPMVVQKIVIGQIYVLRNYQTIFSNNDRYILASFANQAAIAVRNAWLYNQVREQNLRMTALMDSVADGIFILTPELNVESINPGLERMLGISSSQLVGHSFDELLRWKNPPQGLRINEAAEGNWSRFSHDQMYVEGDLLRGGGLEPLPVSIIYAPLFSNRGDLLNVIGSVRDITRFRTAEEMKSSFISVISHELKTPIALIKGYVSTLRREDAEWDANFQRESLRVIEDEADRLTGMVDDLLVATRLQEGEVSLKKTAVHLPELAQELVKRFSVQAEGRALIVDFPPDFPEISADEVGMDRLLSNLLSNAIKYSETGEIRISGKVIGDQVQVCVTDQGRGFDPVDIPYVFNRFYRSERVAKTTKGTGLGLYLCKSIVEAHGGKIWIDETYKQGGRICFSLPGILELNAPQA